MEAPAAPPRIVVTVQSPEKAASEEIAWRKNDRYFEGVRRSGGEVMVLDETSTHAEREAAFASMDGLLLSGGADLDPARYGQAPHPSTAVEPGRDALEAAAFEAAEGREVPIFGICRGMQAINVFRGGSLLQDLDGHTSPAYPAPEARSHALRLDPASRLARILGEREATVNSYHHQGFRAEHVGRELRVAGTSPHPDGELVEALEDARSDRWMVAVQSHPERTEFTSPEFERLWDAFIAAAAERRGARS
ncbi:MAG: gamma-glutamyl-gamma-aminobutyrate hydrolase family protein [Candidatus Limnocylindria bacterium]